MPAELASTVGLVPLCALGPSPRPLRALLAVREQLLQRHLPDRIPLEQRVRKTTLGTEVHGQKGQSSSHLNEV